MDDTRHAMDVADEQSRNLTYLRIMQDKVNRKTPISVSRSATWTGTGLPVPVEPTVGPLVGRVGLAGHDDDVGGTSFYIGPWHVDQDGITVFSWAAPVAAAFYGNHTEHELTHEIAVRRTMHLTGERHEIRDFSDDWVSECDIDPFARRKGLSIPKPPENHASAQQPSVPEPSTSPKSDQNESPSPTPAIRTASTTMRAEAAVRAALTAPRRAGLTTLLATLQPDQYDFVTRPADELLVIQGHPGTGKTVIAAHRAAFLVHPERNSTSRTVPKVLLVGPNAAYTKHVKGVLDALVTNVPSPVTVMGLNQLMMWARQDHYQLVGTTENDHNDVSLDLGKAAEAAAHELIASRQLVSARSSKEAVERVYNALKHNKVGDIELTDDPDLIKYLRHLPSWKIADASRRFLPLLALCTINIIPPKLTFDHIIVDEAQDLRPVEWQILRKLNRRDTWTILGDLNQRRSDWSYHTWTHVMRDLELIEEEEDFTPQIFTRGYRSTAEIITFANRLLPKDQRKVDSIQREGSPPTVVKATDKKLADTTVTVALDLRQRHSHGTTAIITMDRNLIHKTLIRSGWTLDPNDKRIHQRGDHELYLLAPDLARGLEFDAVVVVEPADFPPNLGRMGLLYTSLTRANRELAVVHAKPLPDDLRRHGTSKQVAL